MTSANINMRNWGQKFKSSIKGFKINTAPMGPYIVTTPPNIAQITTVKDMETSRLAGPAILIKWA
jgi:hypothetical protein